MHNFSQTNLEMCAFVCFRENWLTESREVVQQTGKVFALHVASNLGLMEWPYLFRKLA